MLNHVRSFRPAVRSLRLPLAAGALAAIFLLFTSDAGAFPEIETAKLFADQGTIGHRLGASVAIDGNTVIAGAPNESVLRSDRAGAAYVFVHDGTGWSQQARLIAGDYIDRFGNPGFGRSVAIDGDTALVGVPFKDTSISPTGLNLGVVYVFVRTGSTWTREAKLAPPTVEAHDNFGSAVGIRGDTAIISARHDDDRGSNAGAAYIYVRSGGTWTLEQKITADDAAANDQFGISASISGDTALVGAWFDDDSGTNSGAAYTFTRNAGIWSQESKLTPNLPVAGANFGWPVALDEDAAVIGAARAGAAYTFSRTAGAWTQEAKLVPDGANSGYFGSAVSISGSSVLVGAQEDDDRGTNSGSAYLFAKVAGAWNQISEFTASDGAATDRFGESVGIDRETAVMGATSGDGVTANTGAVYVFTQGPPQPPLADAGEDDELIEGGPTNFDGSGSADQDSVIGSYIPTYSWDFDIAVDSDGDGDPANDEDGTGITTSHIYPDTGVYVAQLTYTDDDGVSDTDQVTITVEPDNVPPVITGISDDQILENGTAVITIDFSDPGDEFPHTLLINCGDGGAAESVTLAQGQSSFTASHLYLDDNPGAQPDTFTVSVVVTDALNESDSGQTTVTVANVSPIVSASGGSILENQTFTLSASFVDPGTLDAHTATISWGDGSPDTTIGLAIGARTLTAAHQYLDDDPSVSPADAYKVTVTVADDDLGAGTADPTVTVTNVAPSFIGSIGSQSLPLGSPVVISAGFTDPGSQDVWTFSIDWGDGHVTSGATSPGLNAVTELHRYEIPGDRLIRVCVGDDDSGVSCQNVGVSFFSTSGHITAGVLKSVDGTSAGFNVRSRNGESVSGEFQIHANGQNLHAHEITALSVYQDRSSGWFAGVLTDGRLFLVGVEDNGEPGKNDVFKLWVGGERFTDPSGALSKGNVQIHG